MDIEIRLYKIYDADLISLAAAGYSIATMMRDAIVAYANGAPLHYYIDEVIDADFNIIKTVHTRFSVPASEAKAVYMLKHIKHRSRNMFCKAVLRDALVQQNLLVFFAKDSEPYLYPLKDINAINRGVQNFTNVIPLSSLKKESKPRQAVQDMQPDTNPFVGMAVPHPVIMSKPVQVKVSVPQKTQTDSYVPSKPAPEPAMEVSSAPVVVNVPESTALSEAEPESNIGVQNIEDASETPMFNTDTFDALDKLMGNDYE